MKRFILKHTVTKEEIDNLNHVNNVVYVQWIQDIAGKHWQDLIKDQAKQHYIWVVIRHEIDYLKSAKLEDNITLKTWVGESKGLKSIRYVEIFRNQDLLAKAKTTWCMLDTKTHRPLRITEDVLKILNSS